MAQAHGGDERGRRGWRRIGFAAGVGAALSLAAGCRSSEPEVAVVRYGIADTVRTVAVDVSTEPQGARVFVDGVDSGKVTPARVEVDAGREHALLLRHPAFLPHDAKIMAEPGKPVKVEAKLAPGARIEVTSTPPGAAVELDGQPAFTAPGMSDAVANGRHEIVVKLAGYVTDRSVIEIKDAEPVSLSIALARGAEVAVTSMPPGATILLDGRDTGARTPADVTVPLGGGHALGVKLEGYLPQSRKLRAAADQAKPTFDFALVSARSVELEKRIAALDAELRALEAKLDGWRNRRSGVVVTRSIQKELALEEAIREGEVRVEDLNAELDELREELSRAQDVAAH